ncbi:MAG TPA: hypothetical protein VGD98_00065 [Ktedonobacteraceae bacterium]
MDWLPEPETIFSLTPGVHTFTSLIGERRTWQTLLEMVWRDHRGWQCNWIADSLILARTEPEQEWEQRVLRMAKGESTRRSELAAEHLTEQLRQMGVGQLQKSETQEVWLIADGSNLCKPYAQEMPYLMEVLDEDEQLVPGYRMLTVIGVVSEHRGILYQKVLSRGEAGWQRCK